MRHVRGNKDGSDAPPKNVGNGIFRQFLIILSDPGTCVSEGFWFLINTASEIVYGSQSTGKYSNYHAYVREINM